jgi:three-Cys-motif partner protein
MTKRRKEYLVEVEDDGLLADKVGPWAEDKYRRVAMYAEIFSTGMKNVSPVRVYLDLFAGAGHAIIKDTHKRVMASPLLALSVPDRFSKYIFCEKSGPRLDALRRRATRIAPDSVIEYVEGDVNEEVSRIALLVPTQAPSGRVLSFCFVDPFDLGIHFDTIAALSAGRSMDFLILLALGMDATRNWTTYLEADHPKVNGLLGDETWRSRWDGATAKGTSLIQFLAAEYVTAMSKLGYLTKSIDEMIEIRTHDNNMRLYYLAFFSKSEKGYKFWHEVQKYSTEQLGFDLGA